MPQHDDMNIMGEEVQEIMTRIPSFIVRWGITAILGILFIILGVASFLEYPDVISAPVIVRNPNIRQGLVIRLPIEGSGRVRVGQHVFIRLDNYPAGEFGKLSGLIAKISPGLVRDSLGTYYPVTVSLTNGLISDHNMDLSFFGDMPGTADIITRKITVFRRLVRPLSGGTKDR